MDKQMTFDEYCKKNQHSRNCTRLEAFSMGQKSRQAEIDEKDKRIEEINLLIARAKDGYYGFSQDGGDTDNLVKDLEKALRGEHE